MKFEGDISGSYRTPPIGAESDLQIGETLIEISKSGVITVNSPLWDNPYTIGDGDTFRDPRADHFLRVMTVHQFHHFTTRQLSFVEEFETRPGTSRLVRLGHMLDSAKLLNDLGATFEQIVQTAISDLGHPAGSHIRGDFMIGDYVKQDTHDGDLWRTIKGSGFIKALSEEGLIDEHGYLTGSTTTLEQLADPRSPRHEDIAECERPDNNADRAQFTLHEGVLIHDPAEVREAVASIIRVETKKGERMAMSDPEAARLLFKLAVRHQSEDWAEPFHRLIEELIILPDRYLFCTDNPAAEFQNLQKYYPVDYIRTDEGTWRQQIEELGSIDPLIPNVLSIARYVAEHQRGVLKECIGDDYAYKGPVPPSGISIHEISSRRKRRLRIEHDGPSDSSLYVVLPRPKYRGPINSLVATKKGLVRISDIDPELMDYANERRKWIRPLMAEVAMPRTVAKELEYGIDQVNRYWNNARSNEKYSNPANRPPMPDDELEEQTTRARQATFLSARI